MIGIKQGKFNNMEIEVSVDYFNSLVMKDANGEKLLSFYLDHDTDQFMVELFETNNRSKPKIKIVGKTDFSYLSPINIEDIYDEVFNSGDSTMSAYSKKLEFCKKYLGLVEASLGREAKTFLAGIIKNTRYNHTPLNKFNYENWALEILSKFGSRKEKYGLNPTTCLEILHKLKEYGLIIYSFSNIDKAGTSKAISYEIARWDIIRDHVSHIIP